MTKTVKSIKKWRRLSPKWRLISLILGVSGSVIVAIAVFLICYFAYRSNNIKYQNDECNSIAQLLVNRVGKIDKEAKVFAGLLSSLDYSSADPYKDQRINEQTFLNFSASGNFSLGNKFQMVFSEIVFASDATRFLENQNWTCFRNLSSGECVSNSSEAFSPIIFSSPNSTILSYDLFTEPLLVKALADIQNFSRKGEIYSDVCQSNDCKLVKNIAKVFPTREVSHASNGSDGSLGFFVAMLEFDVLYNQLSEKNYKFNPHVRIIVGNEDASTSVAFESNQRTNLSGSGRTCDSPLGFEHSQKRFTLRCRYTSKKFSLYILLWSLAGAIIIVLILLLTCAVLAHIERIEHAFDLMKEFKDKTLSDKLAADAASKAKGVFLATMSHEIRTPLNGVIGMLNLLNNTELTPIQKDYVDTAKTSGYALCALINDVLDLSKIEADKLNLEEIAFDLRYEVDSVLSMFTERMRSKPDVEMAAFVHSDVPLYVMGDPVRLRQVLINLLGNACKFTSKGHIFLCIRMANMNENIFVSNSISANSKPSMENDDEILPNEKSKSKFQKKEKKSFKNQPNNQRLSSKLVSFNKKKKSKSTPSADTVDTLRFLKSISNPSSFFNSQESIQVKSTKDDFDVESNCNGGEDEKTDSELGDSKPVSMFSNKRLTLSGYEAVESCNSWNRIRHLTEYGLGCSQCSTLPPGAEYYAEANGFPSHSGVFGKTVRLVISVEDTGSGIPLKSQESIFRPFVQAEASTTRTHGGTGIGLSISHRLISLMGGTMGFASVPSVGSTFFFDLNLRVAPVQSKASELSTFDLPSSTYQSSLSAAIASSMQIDSSGIDPMAVASLHSGDQIKNSASVSDVKTYPVSFDAMQGTTEEEFYYLSKDEKNQLFENFSGISAILIDHKPVRWFVTASYLQRIGIVTHKSWCYGAPSHSVSRPVEVGQKNEKDIRCNQNNSFIYHICDSDEERYGNESLIRSQRRHPEKPFLEAIFIEFSSVQIPGHCGIYSDWKKRVLRQMRKVKTRSMLTNSEWSASAENNGNDPAGNSAEKKNRVNNGEVLNPAKSPGNNQLKESIRSKIRLRAGHVDEQAVSTDFSNETEDSMHELLIKINNSSDFTSSDTTNFENEIDPLIDAPSESAVVGSSGQLELGQSEYFQEPCAPKLDNHSEVSSNLSNKFRYVIIVKDMNEEAEAKASGCDLVVMKPLRQKALTSVMQQLFYLEMNDQEYTGPAPRSSQNLAGDKTFGPGSVKDPGHSSTSNTLSISDSKSLRRSISGRRRSIDKSEFSILINKRFLVVDDNAVNRKVISKTLQQYEVNVDCVSSGFLAIEKLMDGQKYDCILMDVMMPEMDGFETTERIRSLENERWSGMRNLILALTADIIAETRQKCSKSGMDGFLSKPIVEEQLRKMVAFISAKGNASSESLVSSTISGFQAAASTPTMPSLNFPPPSSSSSAIE